MRIPSGRAAIRPCLAIAALLVAVLGSLALVPAPRAVADATQVPGMDVSGYQGNVDWPAAWAAGARFAYVKATEGTSYRNPYFAQQYNGSYAVGMIRGAYHFARPDISTGAAQADFFVAHGGGWSPDGRTLPPMLDIEYNPYGPTCYGLTQPSMVDWIRSFSEWLHAATGRWPMLYTTTDWWTTCTGNSPAFGNTHPLFIARYAGAAGPLPDGWRYYTMWQYSDAGNKPGDQDIFAGSMQQLSRLADGDVPPPATSAMTAPATTTPATTTPATTTPATVSTPTPTATTTSTPTPVMLPQDAPAISGLVWAGQRIANPPQLSRGNATARTLTARAYPPAKRAPVRRPTSAVGTTVRTTVVAPPAYPSPTTTRPPVIANRVIANRVIATRALAGPGADPVGTVTFGVSLLLLGAVLWVLLRVGARR